jgi:hypothetical protein
MKPSPNGGGFVFIYMKPFEKFLNDTLGTKELLEIYLELRQHFQELGFSEDEVEKIKAKQGDGIYLFFLM